MLKLTTKSFFMVMLVVSSSFADDTLSTFHQQVDINYPEPLGEESYFAKKAPMSSEVYKYFGVNVGANLNSLKTEVFIDGVSGPSEKHNPISLAAGAYGGYGINFNHFYIGAELSANYNFLNKKINTTVGGKDIKLSVKQPMIAGFDIIPGYITQSKNVLFYGRLGLGTSWIKLGLADVANSVDTSVSKFSFGLRAGCGIEYFMSDTFSVRIEYIYSGHGEVSEEDKTINNKKYSYKMDKTGVHQVNLGLSVHF